MATLYEQRKSGRRIPADAVFLDRIDDHRPARGRRLIFDDHRDAPRGFAVRVRPSGRPTFCLRYKVDGRDRLMTIGDYPTWPLAAAREQAEEERRKVDRGHDPLDDKAERRAAITFAKAVDKYCEHRADKKASGPAIRRALKQYAVAEFGQRKLASVRRPEIVDLVERVATEHGRQAALLLTYLKSLYRWAEDRGHVEASPVGTIKPAEVADELKPVQRERVLDADEVCALWNRTDPPDGMHRRTLLVLHLILATAQRPGEVARMRWRDLDLERGIWVVPAAHRGKTDDHHSVPLTATALDLIERARALSRTGAANVFEQHRDTAMDTSSLSQAVRATHVALANRDDEQWGHWRPHDLRRTAHTGMTASGVAEAVALRTTGHIKKGMSKTYDQYEYMIEKRRALEAWERRLATIAHGEDPDAERADVVSIDERREVGA